MGVTHLESLAATQFYLLSMVVTVFVKGNDLPSGPEGRRW